MPGSLADASKVDGTTTPAGSELLGRAPCSACGAAVRDGAPWCTLCLTPTASTEPAPEARAAAAPAPVTASVTAPADLSARPPARPVPGGWPCSACGHPNSLGLSACAVCGSGFLARLAAEDAPSLVLPLVGDMRTLSRSHHLALAGAVLTGVLAVLLLSAFAGMLLA